MSLPQSAWVKTRRGPSGLAVASPHWVSANSAGHTASPLGVSVYSSRPPCGVRTSRPSSTSPASRSVRTALEMPRWCWKSLKRRTPKKQSRRISSVQRSPTISSERASEQSCVA